ncbi:uncharacterized protein LOC116298852 [Actinia tenebrosa]|uniref:Uncharacterized protein LOC116298852 n=1 Tax=Actinia tenebrosa TaxID=6105 RepID=A0A6P8I5R6_ACTTE|nr:uncharacterized protein LOC116298852 [Actinia tenebrosa]
MSKDQPNDRGNSNDLFRHGEEKVTKSAESLRDGQHIYPRLPSYSEVPSTHPSYLQYNHSNENYLPPWHNGSNVQDTGVPQGSRFGLIRGFHQQMYEQNQNSLQCCDCASFQVTKHGSKDAKCNWGVIFGLLLIILGVFALIMGFTLPQKSYTYSERQRLTPQEKEDIDNINFYIEIFILSGLTVLSLGGIVVSLGILYPACRRRGTPDEYNDSAFSYGSEVYVKEEKVGLSGMEGDQKTLVNFGFHKNVVPTDVTLRKVQPETEQTIPFQADSKLFK